MSGKKRYICKIEARDAPYALKKMRIKKLRISFTPLHLEVSIKPIVITESKDGKVIPKNVHTIIEEKRTKLEKGKIKEVRRQITYARYVYGLDRIPEGWVIWHIDGDPLNNKIENLECITKSELLRRNLNNKYKKNP